METVNIDQAAAEVAAGRQVVNPDVVAALEADRQEAQEGPAVAPEGPAPVAGPRDSAGTPWDASRFRTLAGKPRLTADGRYWPLPGQTYPGRPAGPSRRKAGPAGIVDPKGPDAVAGASRAAADTEAAARAQAAEAAKVEEAEAKVRRVARSCTSLTQIVGMAVAGPAGAFRTIGTGEHKLVEAEMFYLAYLDMARDYKLEAVPWWLGLGAASSLYLARVAQEREAQEHLGWWVRSWRRFASWWSGRPAIVAAPAPAPAAAAS